MKEKLNIIVGMSGGVDSSVAALLLQQEGHQVEGLFMQNWHAEKEDPYCRADEDLGHAQHVCDQLGIPLHTADFSKEYWDKVFQHFLDEYAAGRTPNPDILCNKEIKFRAFLNHALDKNADCIATGHYVRTQKINDQYALLKGLDPNKDQSYFLHCLNQTALSKSLFPIGALHKKEVRTIAKEAGFENYDKKDSTGLCFIGERRFKEFLAGFLLAQPGDIRTEEGRMIGHHDGIMFYTLGQRKGLQIGGRKDASEAPWYVIDKDVKENTLIVGQHHDHPRLLSTHVPCTQLHWISGQAPTAPFACSAKTRYRQTDAPCTVRQKEDEQWIVEFDTPQWAVTPGQYVVFYDDNVCLGGGVIL